MNNNLHIFDKYTDSKTLSEIVDWKNVSEMWGNSVRKYSSEVAVVDSGRSYSYSDLDNEIGKLRGVLRKIGIEKNDTVAVFLENSADWIICTMAVITYGATALLLPPQLDEVAVFGCSMKFGYKALLYSNTLQSKLSVLESKRTDVKIVNCSERSDYEKACDSESDSGCVIMFTGGTTGKSKGALLSHRAVIRGAKNGCYGYKDVFKQRYFLILPLTHVFGFIRNLMTCLYTGSSLYICHNPKDMFKEIPLFKPTLYVLVPALAEMALNLSRQFGRNMLGDDTKYIICGAAMVSPYLVSEYKKYNISLLPGYGLTESANLVSGNPEPEKKAASVGFVYPGIETKIVDGELWLKGPNMLTKYIGDDEENNSAFEDGWFKTGDLVSIDEEGFLFITGRKKEIIVLSSGENVSPAEIENEFNKIPCIQDCLVYEESDHLTIEVLPRSAAIENTGNITAEEFIHNEINKVNMTLPQYKRISKIVIRDKDFVRTPAMKIMRNQPR